MRCASAALEVEDTSRGPCERAQNAMGAAEAQAQAFGASTALVLTLEDVTLGVANLGDSGFALLRRSEFDGQWAIVERSTEQQHYWNCPYQLMRLPQSLMCRLRRNARVDTAADCKTYELIAQPGDLVLLYTDGFGDNLHEEEVLEVVNRAVGAEAGESPRQCASPEEVARELAEAAEARSLDSTASVPFSEASRRQGNNYHGGKPDDITVVAAWVMAGGLSPSPRGSTATSR